MFNLIGPAAYLYALLNICFVLSQATHREFDEETTGGTVTKRRKTKNTVMFAVYPLVNYFIKKQLNFGGLGRRELLKT